MERRTALACAAAGALLSASAVAVTSTALGGGRDQPMAEISSPSADHAVASTTSTSPDPVVVTETRDVYDTIVVPTPEFVVDLAAEPSRDLAATSGPTVPGVVQPLSEVGPTTTTAPTTTTTRPPGVPEDWPADRPIPPMPAGCQKPQLEDDGTWNCDH